MTLQFEQTKKRYILSRYYVLSSWSNLISGIALLFAIIFLYLVNAITFLIFTLGAFTAIGLLIGVAALAGFHMFKNKKGLLPMSLEVTSDTLRLTIGDKQSKNVVTKIIEQDKVSKVWAHGKCVFVNYGLQTYPILVPEDKYGLLTKALAENEWFAKRQYMPKRRALVLIISVVAAALGVLTVYLFRSELSTHFTVPIVVELEESDILPSLNAARADHKVGALTFDQNLVSSASRSCHDMEIGKYYDSKNPKNGHKGYEYISEVYPGSYVDEVTLGVTNFSANDVVTQWVNDNSTKEWVLSATYTKAGVATCKYTADGQSRMLVVLHMAS